ncbi:Gag-Pol polyprotein [Gossypium australe]|uniref:Gag-Pol polyprotein n=1 Tax=Gossypium australe TaxID=47621 RepID=A0A5B6W757_9ROSI|nr:Gag-Pol polyprotein [Gossypium australe]
MMVIEYERKFVRLSKYARECVSTEAIMCKRFEDGLNEDIRLFVGILELKEFVMLVERACKAKELAKEKIKAEIKSRDSRKRQLGKSFQSSSKKLKEFTTRSATLVGFSNKSKDHLVLVMPDQVDRNVHSVVDVTPVSAEQMTELVSSVVPKTTMVEKEKFQSARSGSTTRGRPQKKLGNGTSNKNTPREQTVRSEGRAPARTYAIRACEEASSPDVITGTFFSL